MTSKFKNRKLTQLQNAENPFPMLISTSHQLRLRSLGPLSILLTFQLPISSLGWLLCITGQDSLPLGVPASVPFWLQVKRGSHPVLLPEHPGPPGFLCALALSSTSLPSLPILPLPHSPCHQSPSPFPSCYAPPSPAARRGLQPFHLEQQILLPSQLLSELADSLKTNKQKAPHSKQNKQIQHLLLSFTEYKARQMGRVSRFFPAFWTIVFSSSQGVHISVFN